MTLSFWVFLETAIREPSSLVGSIIGSCHLYSRDRRYSRRTTNFRNALVRKIIKK